MMQRILLVDDHPIVRHGLTQLINTEADLEVCGEASDVVEAIQAVAELKPDLVLVDISLRDSNGLELIKQLRSKGNELPLLVLSMHDESLYAERALRAGANGYVMKEQADETVIEAIRKILAGDLYVSKKVSVQMLRQFIGGPKSAAQSSGVERLIDRELEIFERIGKGQSTHEIAEKLSLSGKTVEAHRAHIKKKLQLENATQLVHQAIRWVEREAGM